MSLPSCLRAGGFQFIQDIYSGKNWSLVTASSSNGLQTVPCSIVYFTGHASWTTVKDAAAALPTLVPDTNYCPLVNSKSLAEDLDHVSKVLGTTNPALTTRRFLSDVL